MKRVVIIGSPGFGKTTFARKLAAKTGLPLIHLDMYYHNSNTKYYDNKEAWKVRVLEFSAQDSWIIDGNYGSTMAARFERADTIIYFDMPRRKAFYGIAKRQVQHINKKRVEMPDGWKEKPNWAFLKYAWGFQKKYKEGTKQLLAQNKDKRIVIFKNRKQIDVYLKMLD